MGQLASDATRISTQLNDSQVSTILKGADWAARKQALLLACQGARSAIEGRLPMLAQLSRSLVTTAGRDSTPPGLMIPAWDNGSAPQPDVPMQLPYNLWDPSQQQVVNSYMDMAWNRWIGSNHNICNAVVNGASGGRLVFDLKKDLTGTELANFLQTGWVDFSVTLSDWLNAYSIDSNISPSVWRKDPSAWSALVSAPVVWNVALQACTGALPADSSQPFDPCCDSKSTGCTTPLVMPTGSGDIHVVRMSAGWVPTQNSTCDYLSTETDVNPNYFVNNKRPPTSNPTLFPLITQTCKSQVIVPAVYQSIKDISASDTRAGWAFDARAEVCASVGSESMTFTPLRGVPLLGDWVLTNTLGNAQQVARYNLFLPQGAPPVITPPPTSFSTDNSKITAIRILVSAMAEPSSSKGPSVYTLLTTAPPASSL